MLLILMNERNNNAYKPGVGKEVRDETSWQVFGVAADATEADTMVADREGTFLYIDLVAGGITAAYANKLRRTDIP